MVACGSFLLCEFVDIAQELLHAAGLTRSWPRPTTLQGFGCRSHNILNGYSMMNNQRMCEESYFLYGSINRPIYANSLNLGRWAGTPLVELVATNGTPNRLSFAAAAELCYTRGLI
jgi:hypothetical protein